ncbi:hypothetical protein [Actinosynnema sp. ALI-1.44]|uniref:hypothetical protein n=1 Tax=Actinosynnema sp. ALI-1.44 TaxID=1933779 RepID=UPI00143DD648|nr:hypothetical protein [Actinosynnema sp. ALI-1.44]
MVDELAEKRRSGRVEWVVDIVGAQFGVGDQPDRALLQWILGVHDAAGLAELAQRLQDLRGGLGERGKLEDPSEEPRIGRGRLCLSESCSMK